MRLPSGIVLTVLAMALLPACADNIAPIGETRGAVVYGVDDRTEYFDVSAPEARARLSGSMVALIPNSFLSTTSSGDVAIAAPSWGEVEGLCPGEPFVDQPAAAFCTGILVDWDLVLTAGHCARVRALDKFSVVFGYYYLAPGQLAPVERREPTAIVAEALTLDEEEPWLDYAWLRLDHPVAPPWQPAPIRAGTPDMAVGERIVSVGAGGGVPLKLDAGGKVSDARRGTSDYFIAGTDTSRGSSGGGAFDPHMALAGILAQGEPDFALTDAGCSTTARLSDDPESSGERFTYVQRALEGLCQDKKAAGTTTICRPDCGDPCQALPAEPGGDGGCQYAPGRAALGWLTVLGAAIAFMLVGRTRPARLP